MPKAGFEAGAKAEAEATRATKVTAVFIIIIYYEKCEGVYSFLVALLNILVRLWCLVGSRWYVFSVSLRVRKYMRHKRSQTHTCSGSGSEGVGKEIFILSPQITTK